MEYFPKERGFTLIELLSTLSIVAILLGLALPSADLLIRKTRSDSAVREIMSLLNYARGEAVSHADYVVICPKAENRYECAKDWSQQLLVFIDDNDDHLYTEAAGEKLLQIFKIAEHGENVMWRSFGNRPYIRFDQFGGTRFQNGRIYYCAESGINPFNREVILYRTGRARIVKKEYMLNRCS